VASRPDEIRDEIEYTRQELADDVDRLADRTVPSRVVHRRWEGVKDKVRGVTDSVMGRDSSSYRSYGTRDTVADKAADARGTVKDAAARTSDRVSDAAQGAVDTVRHAPQAAMRQTQGNPLAAGLIAFGFGALVASLIPETEAERRAGAKLAERSDQVMDVVRQQGQELKESAKDAAAQVKETATQAAGATAEQAKESGKSTVEQTKEAAS
jgi:hypothetical protein